MTKQILMAAAALLWMVGKTEAAPPNVRTYVLYGQGGRLMSYGMEALAKNLQKMDSRVQVSARVWKNYNDVVKDIA